MSEADKSLTYLFTKGSHQKNISAIHIVQNLLGGGGGGGGGEQATKKVLIVILVIFKNPRDMSQISCLARQMYLGNSKYMEEAYKDTPSAPHGYLLLDLKQTTLDNLGIGDKCYLL